MLNSEMNENIARRTHEEPTEFAINSYVLVGYPKTAHNPGPPTKFHARLKGPMQVVNKQGNTYTLRNLVSNQTKDYHITALRQFIYDPANVDPRVDPGQRLKTMNFDFTTG